MNRTRARPLTRDEELRMISEYIANRGLYRAQLGESSEQPAPYRVYKQKKSAMRSTYGKRRMRDAPTIAARERHHAAGGGLLDI